MRKVKQILPFLLLIALLLPILCIPALAITESEVEAQVTSSSKGAVTGNVLIWFLCAVAFLKVSQKIDSIMAMLGVNVGRTGGSMLSEAMIAMRSVTMIAGLGRPAGGGRSTGGASGPGSAGSSAGNSGWFLKGGLAGVVSRKITNSAIKTATTQTSAVNTAQNQVKQATAAAAHTASDTHVNSAVHTGGSSIHTENSLPSGPPPQEGVIFMGGEVSAQPTPIENAPPSSPVPGGMPPQEGVILTGKEAPLPIPPTDPSPQMVGAPDSMPPPQEGVILTGKEAPPSIPVDSPLQAAEAPVDMAPPQEGVILTGSEAPAAIPADPALQPVTMPPEGSSAEILPPQTGSAAPPSPPPAGVGTEQHTRTHSERTTQTSHTAASHESARSSHSHTSKETLIKESKEQVHSGKRR